MGIVFYVCVVLVLVARASCICNTGYTGPDAGPCSACVAGKYKAASGSASCASCGIRTFSSTAAASCTTCPLYSQNFAMGSTTCTSCSFSSSYSDCTSITCAAGSDVQQGRANVSLSGACVQLNTMSSGVFSDGAGTYNNNANCTWIISSTTPVVVSFSSFDLESTYDVIYIQRCTQQGVCDAVPSTSWGKNVSTQEIVLLTGNAPIGPEDVTIRYIPTANDISAPTTLCGPTAKTACIGAFGGYSGPSVPPPYVLYYGPSNAPTTLLFDGDFSTSADGGGIDYSNWIRIDFSRDVAVTSIVLWTPSIEKHWNWESFYMFNVNVYASSTPSFNLTESVLCAGPFTYLWWTQAQLQANTDYGTTNGYTFYAPPNNLIPYPWYLRNRSITCNSAVSRRYLYITYTPGTWTWPAFGEIQVYGNAIVKLALLVYDPGPWVSNTGYMKVQFSADFRDSYAGFVGSWTSTAQCTDCKAGSYKSTYDAQACTACPPNSNSPGKSAAVAACACNAGYTGVNGGTCTACASGQYKAGTGSASCATCAVGTTSSTAAASCSTCPLYSQMAIGSTTCTSCSFSSSYSDCTSITCAAGSDVQQGRANVSLSGACAQSSGMSSGTFSDGAGNYNNDADCTWIISSTTPVVVSFSSFDVESTYDVIYIQRCTEQGVCDTVLRNSWGTSVSTQEIALLTGLAPIGPKNATFRYVRSTSDVPPAKAALCGPTANPACTAAFGGYSGTNVPAPFDLYFGVLDDETTRFFDGNLNTRSQGPSAGYSNWLRIDCGGNVNFSTVVLWNPDSSHHRYWLNYYVWNLNVYASSTSRFNLSESVKCAGPFAYVWWTRAQMDANTAWATANGYFSPTLVPYPWQQRSKVITCNSSVSGRYLYITYTPGGVTWPVFSEIQVYGNATANPAVLVQDRGPWVSNTGYMKVQFSADFRDSYSGFEGSWTSTSQCSVCKAGSYKGTYDAQACSACPANSNSPSESSAVAACACNAGYTGVNGGTCTACGAGQYKNVSGRGVANQCQDNPDWHPWSPDEGCSFFAPGGAYDGYCLDYTDFGTCSDCCASCGHVCPGGGGGVITYSCSPCAVGTFSATTGATACAPCAAGKYTSTTGTATCSDCPASTYSTTAGANAVSMCTSCPANSGASCSACSASSGCTCNIGYTGPNGGVCTACAAGRYKSTTGPGTCVPCEAGTYTSTLASGFCVACPQNSGASCSACTSLSNCTCNRGYTGPAGGTCTACSVGKYKNTSGADDCTSCGPGKYTSTLQSLNCTSCPANSGASCSECSGLSSCLCNTGYAGPDGGACTPCVTGTYKNTSGSANCTSCVAGSYSTTVGANAASKCTACPANSGASCSACSAVSGCACNIAYTGSNGGNCTACAAGKYKNSTGSAACTNCTAGSYADTSGASACTACPENTVGATSGLKLCLCALGYQPY